MNVFERYYRSCEHNKARKRETKTKAEAKKYKLVLIHKRVAAKAKYVYKIGPHKSK